MKRFDLPELIENRPFKEHLSQLFSGGKNPGALLITGEDGCGRNFAARLTAREYLEDDGLAMRGIHPDLLTVSGTGASGQISIDSVREAAYECSKAAVAADGRRAVFIRDAFNLNPASANALLKTLEQPPEGVLFILTARRESDMISTVLSRCVTARVSPVSSEGAYNYTLSRFPDADPSRVRHICDAFQGRLGGVIKTLSDQRMYVLFNESELALNAAAQGKKLEFGAHFSAAENRADYRQMIYFMYRIAASPLFDATACAAFLEKLAEAYVDLEHNINLQLLSSMLMTAIQE